MIMHKLAAATAVLFAGGLVVSQLFSRNHKDASYDLGFHIYLIRPESIEFFSSKCDGLYDWSKAHYHDGDYTSDLDLEFDPQYEEDLRIENLYSGTGRLMFDNCGKPSRKKPAGTGVGLERSL